MYNRKISVIQFYLLQVIVLIDPERQNLYLLYIGSEGINFFFSFWCLFIISLPFYFVLISIYSIYIFLSNLF